MIFLIDRCYHYVLGILVGLVVFILEYNLSDVKNLAFILEATITFSSIIIAFLSTMVSIFISLINSEVMKRIKSKDGDGLLTSYIAETVLSGLLLVFLSIILFMFINYSGKYSNLLLSFYVLLLVFLFSSSFRILKLTSNILKNALNEKELKKKIDKPKVNLP